MIFFFFFEFKYFYKSLFLLIIPLIIKVVHFIFKDIAEENSNFFIDVLGIEDKGIDNQGKQIYSYNIKEEYSDSASEIGYYMNRFCICKDILFVIECYESYANHFNAKINLIVYSLFFIGWLSILLKNIYLAY